MLQSRSNEWLSDPLRPLFELESGGAASGSQISGALKPGASGLGPDSHRYATHSLRHGGATAMAASGGYPHRCHSTMRTVALGLLAPIRVRCS